MNVLCCGSRDWKNSEAIGRRIAELPDDTLIIEGHARGADMIAGSYALGRGLWLAQVPVLHAHWQRYGKRAGILRNTAMLDLAPDLVLAFTLGTPGTQHTIDEARRRGIKVEVHDGR